MDVGAYLYPWDIVGDPAAPDLIAGLGLDHVVLAAVYHGTRAVTPRHPQHRIVVAERTAAYYPLDAPHWGGAALQPARTPGDPFGAAAAALRAVGLPVYAWAVVNHVDALSSAEHRVVNAYGDRYPWALCPAQAAVVGYATNVATDLAALPGIVGVDLESCGWYGFDHLSAHDKTGSIPGSPAMEYLLSLCFCPACHRTYAAAGIDAVDLRVRVRDGADRLANDPIDPPAGDERAQIAAVLGEALADQVFAVRQGVADGFRHVVVDRLRSLRPDLAITLHANPQPHRSLSNTGVDPTVAGRTFDGLVVNAWTGPEAISPSVAGGARVHASLLAVGASRNGPDDLVFRAIAARQAGAHGLRVYHAGLASTADIGTIRDLTSQIRKEP